MTIPAPPDLSSDPETQRVRASVTASLFGDATEEPKIGRYRVRGQLGHGAMGVVYDCYDDQLDRRVAVKLVRGDLDAASLQIHSLREGQALARLSHPNVVHVYEVGEHEGRVFVAMELVAGQTLRQWSRVAARPWPEALAICIAAGRGLAAAHAQGLVHRDFKPDNVMVGDDGGVRITDFGLARLVAPTDGVTPPMDPHGPMMSVVTSPTTAPLPPLHTEGSPSPRDTTVASTTNRGAVVGTPAYMAPEQRRRGHAGPLADQFAFCLTLWETLYGQRPSLAATGATAAATSEPRGREPPVPRWLRAAILRGLAEDPAARWPTMDALLLALDRGTTRARRRRVLANVVALGIVVVGAIGWHALRVRAREMACERSGDAIAEVWNDDTRAAVHDALVATDAPYAERVVARIVPALDRRAEEWRDARTTACTMVSLREEWDEELLDRSSWCLEDRKLELGALVEVLSDASRNVAAEADGAVSGMSELASCLDEASLRRTPVPPAEGRAPIRAVLADVFRSWALGLVGTTDDSASAALVERADAIGWEPLQALVRQLHANAIYNRRSDYAQAEAIATEAYFLAANADAWEVAADAAILLTTVVGRGQHRPVEGAVWNRHAELALGLAGESEGPREVTRLLALALVREAEREVLAAQALLRAAMAIQSRLLGPDHPKVAQLHAALALAHRGFGDYDEARTHSERALAITEATLGPDHPQTMVSLTQWGLVLWEMGAYEPARTAIERAAAVRAAVLPLHHSVQAHHLTQLGAIAAALGEHDLAIDYHQRAVTLIEAELGAGGTQLGVSLAYLAQAKLATGDLEASRVAYERALAIHEAALGSKHPDVALHLQHLARWYEATGDFAGARARHERAVGICTPDSSCHATALAKLAESHRAAGELVRARELHRQVLDIRERTLPGHHAWVARSLTQLAIVEAQLAHHDDARRLLERAVAIYETHAGAGETEYEARFALARALVATGGDRARARALAEDARTGYRAAHRGRLVELAEVDAWLTEPLPRTPSH